MLKLFDIRSTAFLLALVFVALVAGTPASDRAPTEHLPASEARPVASTRFYPMGWFDGLNTPGRLVSMRSAGMNAVLPYTGTSQAGLNKYLNEARSRGLKVWVEIDRAAVATANPALVRGFVELYRKHPAVAGWLLADEPTLNPLYAAMTPGVAKLLYRQIKGADPSRHVAIVFGVTENPRPYVSAMDVLMYDDYVMDYGKPEFYGLWAWRKRLEDRASIAAKLDGYIPVLQGYGQDAQGRPQRSKRLPTTKELRYLTFASIQHKATGIFFWARYLSRTDWVTKVLSPLSKDIAPALGAFAAGPTWGTAIGYGKSMRTLQFRNPASGARYLVVVNHGAGSTKAQIKLSKSFKMERASSKTGGSYYVGDGHFERTFGPYEAHMYRLTG